MKKLTNKYLNSSRWMPYLLIAPTLVLIFAFLFYPVLNVFRYSTMHYNLAKPKLTEFIGLGNFKEIFTDDKIFAGSLWVSVKWVVMTVSFQIIIGMIISLALNRNFRGQGLVRTILVSPWAFSGVLVSTLWILLTHQNMGFINNLMVDLGIWETGVAFTGNPKTVFATVVSAAVWRGVPFFVIIFLASLQNIPLEIYDSAKVDGANGFQFFWKIILPFLKQTVIFSSLLRIIWEYNNIDLIYVITKGGPMNMTLTLAMYTINTAIKQGNYGYGSTLNVISFLFMLIFMLIYLGLSKKYAREEL